MLGGRDSGNGGGTPGRAAPQHANHDDYEAPPAGRREAQPTGGGPGYGDEDIPF